VSGQVVDRILVRFEGEGSGVEDVTWGQMAQWQSIIVSGQSRTLGGISGLPPGTTVEDVADDLRYAMARHQALRTRLRLDGEVDEDGDIIPRQECSATGEFALEVVDAGDDDPAEVAAAVLQRRQTVPFDYENEWPIRMSVVRKDGVLTQLVAVYLHLVIDAGGLEFLIADGAARPRDGSDPTPVTAMQPLDQARWQQGPAGQRLNASAQRYLEHTLRAVPMSRFGEPRYPGAASFREVRYRSPALLLAVGAASIRCQANTSSVLLASFAVALGRIAGRTPILAMLTVSNRFRPRLGESVSALAQVSPYVSDVADITIGEAVGRAERSTLSAYKNAYFAPVQQDDVYRRVFAERGGAIDLSCYYNDRRRRTLAPPTGPVATADEIRAALASSTHDWVEDPEMPGTKLYLYVDDPPGSIDLLMSVDLRYFSPDDLLTIVREIESVAVDIALDPTLPTEVRAPATVR
jgi:hypothetical protein